MNSHERHTNNRMWQRKHAEEIIRLIKEISGRTHFEFSHISHEGIIEMCEKRSKAFGENSPKTSQEWMLFLTHKGVNIHDLGLDLY